MRQRCGCWRCTRRWPKSRAWRAESLQGTTQNDIIKEYLSRGTYVFPPAPSLRLITDMVAWTVAQAPRWNPVNICSYHLQEAGATPTQELAYSLSTAVAVLDAVRDSGQVRAEELGAGRGPDLVLRQRRSALRRGDVQDARVRRAVGRDHPRAVRRDRPGAAPVPLRRAGELAGPDRGAAGEQRAAHRAGDARGDAVQGRPRPSGAAAGVERGAGAAPAVGPAVVAADPAGAGVRVRPAGVRRPVRRLPGRGGEGRRARRRGADRAGHDRGDGRGGRCGRERIPQERAGVLARAAPRAGGEPASRSSSGSTTSPRPSPTR